MLGSLDFEKFDLISFCWGVLTLRNLSYFPVVGEFDFEKFDFFPCVGGVLILRNLTFSLLGEF